MALTAKKIARCRGPREGKIEPNMNEGLKLITFKGTEMKPLTMPFVCTYICRFLSLTCRAAAGNIKTSLQILFAPARSVSPAAAQLETCHCEPNKIQFKHHTLYVVSYARHRTSTRMSQERGFYMPSNRWVATLREVNRESGFISSLDRDLLFFSCTCTSCKKRLSMPNDVDSVMSIRKLLENSKETSAVACAKGICWRPMFRQ